MIINKVLMPYSVLIMLLENNIDVGNGIGGSREGGVEAHCRNEESNQLCFNTQSKPLNYT